MLEIRARETTVLRKLSYLYAITALLWSCAPFLVAVLTFGVYVTIDAEHNVLTPQITFVGLSLFNILRFPLAVFAMIISQAIQCAVSNRRLKAFLADEEIEEMPSAIEITSGNRLSDNSSSGKQKRLPITRGGIFFYALLSQ